MIEHELVANFIKIGDMDIDKELDRESDVKHLREIIDGLIDGFSCSGHQVSFKIGDVKFSYVGLWRHNYWPDIKLLK